MSTEAKRINVQRIERTLQIGLAKPLAWAIYAGGLTVRYLVTACWRGLRALAKRKSRAARKEGQCPNHF